MNQPVVLRLALTDTRRSCVCLELEALVVRRLLLRLQDGVPSKTHQADCIPNDDVGEWENRVPEGCTS